MYILVYLKRFQVNLEYVCMHFLIVYFTSYIFARRERKLKYFTRL